MGVEKSPTKVITGEVRFSYAHVFEKMAITEGGTPKYSVCLLIDKKDTATIDKINLAIEAAKKAKWGEKIPKVLKLPLRDGDEEKDDENYAGKMFVNCNSNDRPQVVGPDREPIIDKEEFYSGCYGYASINFFGYTTGGKPGVGCGLGNLMKTKDGDKLSGRTSAADDFGDIETDNDL